MGTAGGFARGALLSVSADVGGTGISQLPLPGSEQRVALPFGQCQGWRAGLGGPGTKDGTAHVAEMGCLPGDFAVDVEPGSGLQFGIYLHLL